jgi:uncharacterized protein
VKIILDTNVLMACYSPKSKLFPIWQAFRNKKYLLGITTDIIEEYTEIISEKASPAIASLIVDIILQSPNTDYITKYFFWQLIEADPDDNKFVDCGLMANANYIVTDDRHFNILKTISFPKIEVISAQNFVDLIEKLK